MRLNHYMSQYCHSASPDLTPRSPPGDFDITCRAAGLHNLHRPLFVHIRLAPKNTPEARNRKGFCSGGFLPSTPKLSSSHPPPSHPHTATSRPHISSLFVISLEDAIFLGIPVYSAGCRLTSFLSSQGLDVTSFCSIVSIAFRFLDFFTRLSASPSISASV